MKYSCFVKGQQFPLISALGHQINPDKKYSLAKNSEGVSGYEPS
jgi:hypothetical protein